MSLQDRLINTERARLFIALLALLASLAGVFTLPVLDRDEARFAQASAQMVESGDIVDIRFQDQPRHKKPIGIYWLQSLTVAVTTGPEAREIWTYRLPSVLGAMLAALSAFWMGRRLYDHRTGVFAGALISVSLLLASEGGIAKTDAMLAAMTGLSVLSLVEVWLAETPARRRKWAVLMWVFVALAALIKGPVAPLMLGLAVLALCAIERRVIWLKVFFYWPGPLLAALIILPWLVGVQMVSGGTFLTEALGGDMAPKLTSGHEGHGAPPGSHLLLLPILFLPASVSLPAGFASLIKDWREQTPDAQSARLLVAFIAPAWLLIELLPTKLPHYSLPIYPALAVIAGLGFVRWGRVERRWRLLGLGLLALGGVLAAGVLIALGWRFQGALWAAYLAAGLMTFCGLAATFALYMRRYDLALIALVVLGLSWHGLGRGVVAPSASILFPSGPAALEVADLRQQVPDAQLISTYTEPSFVFLTHGDVQLRDADEIAAELARGDLDFSASRLYVFDLSRWSDHAAETLRPLVQRACAVRLVDGFNYSRGDDTVLLIAATGCSPADAAPSGSTP